MFNPNVRDGNLPTGKGTFIWLMPRLVDQFGSVDALVEELVKDGYQWVCTKAQHGYLLGCSPSYDRTRQIDLLDEFVPMAEAEGIQVHGWGYNFGDTSLRLKRSDQQGKEIARIVEALVRWRFRSWTLNAESEFKVKGGNTAAYSLTNQLRETLAAHPAEIDVPVGLSSYRFPSSHNTYGKNYGFPYWGFLQGCDFSGPQVYWQKSRFPVDQLKKSVKEWNEIVELPIVAAGTLYPEGKWWPSGDQVADFNQAAKEMPEVIATCYWEHYYPFKYNRIDLQAALASFDWPAAVEKEPPPVEEPPAEDPKEEVEDPKTLIRQARGLLQQAEDLLEG